MVDESVLASSQQTDHVGTAALGCPVLDETRPLVGVFQHNRFAIFLVVSPKKHIAIIPGDGIGPEVIAQAVKVLEASRAPVEMTHFDWGADPLSCRRVTVPLDGFAMLDSRLRRHSAGRVG